MKKTLLIVAIVTLVLSAASGSAFGVNRSGQLRLGASAAPSSVRSRTASPTADGSRVDLRAV